MKIIKIELKENAERLDVVLARETGMSRSKIRALIKDGKVAVAGKPVSKCGLSPRDGEVAVEIPEKIKISAEGENIPLKIVYEDEDIAVVDKPKGMVVHPCPTTPGGTLVNALVFRMKNLSSLNGEYRPGIVHRLDKDTSGLIIIAKNDFAHKKLASLLEKREVGKYYLALVRDNIKEDEFVVDKGIKRSVKNRKIMVPDDAGKPAVTYGKVLERFGDYTFVEFRIPTGRTHQIRVHAKYIGHPIVGDKTYGVKDGYEGQFLHAWRLEFVHPRTGAKIVVKSDLPDYFREFLEKLRKEA